MHLRHIAVIDRTAAAPPSDVDVVLALDGVEPDVDGPLVLHPSSCAAAARFVLAGPARVSVALADPVSFLSLVADLGHAPALRAA